MLRLVHSVLKSEAGKSALRKSWRNDHYVSVVRTYYLRESRANFHIKCTIAVRLTLMLCISELNL